MKTFFPLVSVSLAVAMLTPSIGLSAQQRKQALRVTEMRDVTFPYSLAQRGVREGLVEALVSIGTDGRTADALIVSYTARELADIAVDLLKDCSFEPVTRNGVPTPVRTRLSFRFEAKGIVIGQTEGEYLQMYMGRLFPHERTQKIATMADLDRVPKPTKVVSPSYAAAAENAPAASAGRRVTIDFYIDETGRARMPVLDQGEHGPLAEAAAAALLEWQFEPPTRRGEPVIVNARQEFRFGS